MASIYTWTYEIAKSENITIGQVLMSIQSIGKKTASSLCSKVGISINLKAKLVGDSTLAQLQRLLIDGYTVRSESKLISHGYLDAYISMGTYKGKRHQGRLPVRGQRTRSNARTQRRLALLRLKVNS